MAGECQKLKFNRRRLGLTQKAFAELVGLSQTTICQLEKNEDAWTVATDETIDKIYAHYESMASYQPNKKEVKSVMNDIREESKEEPIDPKAMAFFENLKSEKPKEKANETEVCSKVDNHLTASDNAMKKLLNVAFHGLNNAKDHEEFEIYTKLLKKLLKKGK